MMTTYVIDKIRLHLAERSKISYHTPVAMKLSYVFTIDYLLSLQVTEFLSEEIDPILQRFDDFLRSSEIVDTVNV